MKTLKLFVALMVALILSSSVQAETLGSQVVVSHIECNQLLVVMTQAPAGLAGTTGTATVSRPDGSTIEVPLGWVGYFGGTAKWDAPRWRFYLTDYFGIYTVTQASVAGYPVTNLPFSEFVSCSPEAVVLIDFLAWPANTYYSKVNLRWDIASEIGTAGYRVLRNGVSIAVIAAKGAGSIFGATYGWLDAVPIRLLIPGTSLQYDLYEQTATGETLIGTQVINLPAKTVMSGPIR